MPTPARMKPRMTKPKQKRNLFFDPSLANSSSSMRNCSLTFSNLVFGRSSSSEFPLLLLTSLFVLLLLLLHSYSELSLLMSCNENIEEEWYNWVNGALNHYEQVVYGLSLPSSSFTRIKKCGFHMFDVGITLYTKIFINLMYPKSFQTSQIWVIIHKYVQRVTYFNKSSIASHKI